MNDEPDAGRAPGRRQHRPAGRHPARRRPPLRPDARPATRRPLGVGRAGAGAARRATAGTQPAPGEPPPRPARPGMGQPPTVDAAARLQRAGPPPADAEAPRRRPGRRHRRRRPRSCPPSSRPAAPSLVLDRTGALDRTGRPVARPGATQQTGAPQPVTIDESSAVIDAAAKAGPGGRQDHDRRPARRHDDPFGGELPATGIGSGVIYDANGWILTNRHVVAGATDRAGPGRAQGRPPVRGPRLRHRHADRPRDRQGRRARPPGRGAWASSTGSRSASSWSRSAARSACTRSSVTSGIVSGKGRDVAGRQRPADHEPDPDRRGDQPRQLGRPARRRRRRRRGHQHRRRDRLVGHRVRHPDRHRQADHGTRPSPARRSPGRGSASGSTSIDQKVKKANKLTGRQRRVVSTGTANGGPAIVDGSPAAKAGIKDGDIILSINGIQIDQEHPLDALLVQFQPDDTVTLEVLRDGKQLTVTVTLGTRPGNL